jgi:hypothetical protein
MGESPDSGILISDVEREEATRALDEHLATGRLRPAEHEERRVHAKAARTRGEIEALFVDLPAPRPDLSQAMAPATAEQADKRYVSTPGDTLAGVGCMVLLFGVPGAIAFTVLHGIWWTFFLAGGLATVFFVLSEVSDRKHASRTATDRAAADRAAADQAVADGAATDQAATDQIAADRPRLIEP